MCGLIGLIIVVVFAFKIHWLLGLAVLFIILGYEYEEVV